MYNLTLVNYAVPFWGNNSIEKPGNFAAASSAIRAIYHALNRRSLDFEVLVEGVNGKNLEAVNFSVRGELIEQDSAAPKRTSYQFSTTQNLGEKIDVPSLFYIVDRLVEDKVSAEIKSKGAPDFADANFGIENTLQLQTWILRMFSHATMYELRITSNPDYFDRTVVLNMDIDDAVADEEDRRAMLEVATGLADADFRKDGRYELYTKAHRGKPFSEFEIFHMDNTIGNDKLKSVLGKSLDATLGNDYETKERLPEKLTRENFAKFMPKYLVIADRIRYEVKELQTELGKSLVKQQMYEGMLKEANPKFEDILNVKAEFDPSIEEKIKQHLQQERPIIDTTNENQVRIGEQLVITQGFMQKKMQILDSYHAAIKRLEDAGVTAADVFDQREFFNKIANSNATTVATDAISLLETAKKG